MPIVSKNTKLDELPYVSPRNDSYAPRTDSNQPIPVTVPLESSVPFITVPIPRIEDELNTTAKVNIEGAGVLSPQNIDSYIQNLRTPLQLTGLGAFSLSGDIQNLIGSGIGASFQQARLSDNFIRGGLVGVQQAISRDFGRIDAFTKKPPLVFKLKQELLQKSNILFEPSYKKSDKSISTGLGELDIKDRSIREYKVQNTVDQTVQTASGRYYVRHGKQINSDNPSLSVTNRMEHYDEDTPDSYWHNAVKNSQIKDNNTKEAFKTNRLLALYDADRLAIQSNSKTYGGNVNSLTSTTSPPSVSVVSNNNPLFFGGLFSRGSRGGTRIVTLNELRQQAIANVRRVEDRIRRSIEETQLGSVVLNSLRAVNVNVDVSLTNLLFNRRGNNITSRNYNQVAFNYKPQETLYQYEGGPDSLYGIGPTVIRRYEFTGDPIKTNAALERAKNKAGKGIIDNNTEVYLDQVSTLGISGSLIERGLGEGETTAISTHPEVKFDIKEIASAIGQHAALPLGAVRSYQALVIARNKPLEQSFNNFGIFNTNIDHEKYQNTGRYSGTDYPGGIQYQNMDGDKVILSKKNWFDASREQRVGSSKQDAINLTPLFKSDTGFNAALVTIGKDKLPNNINDLVKFRIEAINGDNPKESINMVFRAYITDFSDNVSGEWNDVTYAGRGDKFYIYKGFNRKISVGFRIAALSEEEMKFIYQKLNFLMSNTLPDYTAGGLMRGPLVRMTVGNWIDSQPGILESVDCSVNMSETPWEIAINDDLLILPHIVDIKLNFTPIGAQTQNENKIMKKSYNTSIIAQNYNGKTDKRNYIDDTLTVSSASPYEPPSDAELTELGRAQQRATDEEVKRAELANSDFKNQVKSPPQQNPITNPAGVPVNSKPAAASSASQKKNSTSSTTRTSSKKTPTSVKKDPTKSAYASIPGAKTSPTPTGAGLATTYSPEYLRRQALSSSARGTSGVLANIGRSATGQRQRQSTNPSTNNLRAPSSSGFGTFPGRITPGRG